MKRAIENADDSAQNADDSVIVCPLNIPFSTRRDKILNSMILSIHSNYACEMIAFNFFEDIADSDQRRIQKRHNLLLKCIK